MAKPLTKKQKNLVAGYLSHGNKKQAFEEAYGVTEEHKNYRQYFYRVWHSKRVQQALELVMRFGFTLSDLNKDFIAGNLMAIAADQKAADKDRIAALAVLAKIAKMDRGVQLDGEEEKKINFAYGLPARRGGRGGQEEPQVIDVTPSVAEKCPDDSKTQQNIPNGKVDIDERLGW